MVFHLDHMCLGVSDLADGVRRFREETGLGVYEGGVFPEAGLGVWIVPLGGEVYAEIEGVADPGRAARGAGAWISRATGDGRDRWMFWCLRADTLEELQEVAERLGGQVSSIPGRVQPDGTRRVITSAPGIDQSWRHGLPNWYYRADPASNPARGAVTGGRIAQGVTWLEVGGDETVLRKHLGAETFDRLPLRVVPGEPGLHAVAVRTAEGEEVVLRRPPAGPANF
ncbi:hypothetical protein KALB_6423 [Kutzneria albida DSM 43870]|uniref:Glyoxalase-like domain-containing protein n=1 Tax=Kutzneria albida DSM 43870 TaxID=1449976 RepID=W5WG06_9PSEU|nr:hypothetical protein KALB_6423 [Kutzneria albida DSM 43870]